MEVQEELIKAVFTAAAKASIEKLIRRVGKKEAPIDASLVQNRLCMHARGIMSVKTLLSTDVNVDINEFYCAPIHST